MSYGDFKDLARGTASDKILSDKAFDVAKTLNIMDIKKVLIQRFINFLIKKLLVVVFKMKIYQTKS